MRKSAASSRADSDDLSSFNESQAPLDRVVTILVYCAARFGLTQSFLRRVVFGSPEAIDPGERQL